MLAVDTDVLVSWAMEGAVKHPAARRLLEEELLRGSGRLALAPQVLHELIHVTTDARRFQHPLRMEDALELARSLWEAPEVVRVLPGPDVLTRTLDLLGALRLGRKRILDTALAATLESAGVRRLATFNAADFEVFEFLELVSV